MTQQTTKVFKSELLENFADELKANGFRLFYSPNDDGRKATYFYYTDGHNIGYCQEDYFGGLTFGTVHKPCRQCGTGFRINENGTYEPTIKDAKSAFVLAPNWASKNARQAVIKYKDIDELLSKETILKYVEY